MCAHCVVSTYDLLVIFGIFYILVAASLIELYFFFGGGERD